MRNIVLFARFSSLSFSCKFYELKICQVFFKHYFHPSVRLNAAKVFAISCSKVSRCKLCIKAAAQSRKISKHTHASASERKRTRGDLQLDDRAQCASQKRSISPSLQAIVTRRHKRGSRLHCQRNLISGDAVA